MRIGILGSSLLLLAGAWWAVVHGDSGAPPRRHDQITLMRAKLACSQRIVDGLVTKDFDDISKGAEELVKICKATEWKSKTDAVYDHYRNELVRQADKMVGAAANENLDGAAYSYIHALTTCIGCHEYCRDVLKIAASNPSRIIPIPTTDDEMPPRTGRR